MPTNMPSNTHSRPRGGHFQALAQSLAPIAFLRALPAAPPALASASAGADVSAGMGAGVGASVSAGTAASAGASAAATAAPTASAAASVSAGAGAAAGVSAGTLALALFILVALLALLLMLREAASFALETVRLPADGGASDACAGATPDGNSLGDSGANAQVAAGAEPTAPGAGSYASAMPATASATAGDTGAAPASDSGGLRILHLSDIHLRLLPIPLPKIADAVRRAAPDIVVLTGDYLTSPKDAAPFLDWLSAIIAASGGAAFFLCFGNHDIKAFGYNAFELAAYEKQLKKLGVAVLENRTAIVERGGRAYSITGLRDFSRKPVRAEPALRAAPKAGCYRIGITHNPDIALDLPPRSLDLLLCGHFHGGQIWLPLNLQYTCLRKERLCRMGICSGLHELNGIKLYISRGLGCVLFPLRFRAKPEMTLIIAP